jgi:hypothetical protein
MKLVAVALLPSVVIFEVINNQINYLTEYVHKQNTFFDVKSLSCITASQSEIFTWIYVPKCSEIMELNRQQVLRPGNCLVDKSSIFFSC